MKQLGRGSPPGRRWSRSLASPTDHPFPLIVRYSVLVAAGRVTGCMCRPQGAAEGGGKRGPIDFVAGDCRRKEWSSKGGRPSAVGAAQERQFKRSGGSGSGVGCRRQSVLVSPSGAGRRADHRCLSVSGQRTELPKWSPERQDAARDRELGCRESAASGCRPLARALYSKLWVRAGRCREHTALRGPAGAPARQGLRRQGTRGLQAPWLT